MASIERFVNACFVAAVLSANSLSAVGGTTLDVRDGTLWGAWNVPVGAEFWNVHFESRYVSYFPYYYPPETYFAPPGLARVASQALLDFVLVDGPMGQFDSVPELVGDYCFQYYGEYRPACIVATLYGISPRGRYEESWAVNYPGEGDKVWGYDNYPEFVTLFAIWSSAPEPTTIPLLLAAGLAWLGLRRLRKPTTD